MTIRTKNPVRMTVWCVGAVLLLWVCVWGGFNMTGFCWADKRWLSDEERIDGIIEMIYRQPAVVWGDHYKGSRENPTISYQSVQDFKEKNPNCCQVGQRDFGDGLWSPRSTLEEFLGFGRNADIVAVEYAERFKGEDGQVHTRPKQMYYGSTNCGRMW
ncbi:MAG: hypothetical protein V4735_08710 [Pseudomonadota bacterium]